MLELLFQVPGVDLEKITTSNKDTSSLQSKQAQGKYHLCFVDGEHTDLAWERDAKFCLKVLADDGCIAFHDADVVFRGISNFLSSLEHAGRPFRAHLLPDAVFAVQLGTGSLFEIDSLRDSLQESWRGYVHGLAASEWYRAALNKPLFKFLRRLKFVRRIFVVKGIAGQPI